MSTSSSKTDKQPAKCYDIVIAGGGIAGLYCCYELKRAAAECSTLTVFSFSKRRSDLAGV